MYLGANVNVSFVKGSTLSLAGAVAVKPYNAQATSAPQLQWQNGALLLKAATDIRTTSSIGPGILMPAFSGASQILYQAGAGVLLVNWQLGRDDQSQQIAVQDAPLGKKQGNFQFIGPSLNSAPAIISALAGSTWSGWGTVIANDVTNQGTITPGGAGKIGYLSYVGDVTLGASSTVCIDIAGASASGNFDQVGMTGFSMLGGTLKVTLNGYNPTLGDSYPILTLPGGYAGTFASVQLPTLKAGLRFQVNYDTSDVSLTVVADPTRPSITGLSPNSASSAGGQQIIITGANFLAVKSVLFGSVPALRYTVDSNTQITAIAPAHAAASTFVAVTTATGSAQMAFTYTNGPIPAITSLAPNSGFLFGGTTIIISGSHFTGATGVTFGSVVSPFFQVLSDTQISAVVPAFGSASVVDVHVITLSGTSLTAAGDQFTYLQPQTPTVTQLSPTSGTPAGGTPVVITGTGFVHVYDVQFGGVSAESFTVNSPTSITAFAPPGAPGTVDVTVVTVTAGTSATSTADQFTYSVATTTPVVTGLGTSSGPITGGTSVTITGAHFTGVTGVFFGNVSASKFIVESDNMILAIAPPEAAGIVNVTVTAGSAVSATTPADQFTYTVPPLPTVAGLSQTSGPTAGGTVVTILGSGFSTATVVYFGSVPASKFTLLSDGALVATAPPEAAGTVDVTVTNANGKSLDTAGDQFTYLAPAPVVLHLTSCT
jgi:hypothetical protein